MLPRPWNPRTPQPQLPFFLVFLAVIGISLSLAPLRALAQRSKIDPLRPGDQVEYKHFDKWNPAEVVFYSKGVAILKYEWAGREQTKEYPLAEIRFPNDEGAWLVWSDTSGNFRIEARLVGRDETTVTLRKEDESEITVPIEKLSQTLQNQLAKAAGAVKKMHEQSLVRVGDTVEVKSWWTWYPGTVQTILPTGARVSYDDGGKTKQTDFKYDDMRYPNGEGPWRQWQDKTGEYKVTARYLVHDETHVELLIESGKQVRIEREKLATKHQSELSKATIFARRPDEVDFELATSEFGASSGWMKFGTELPEFSIEQLDYRNVNQPIEFAEGGMEFLVGDADKVSLVVPIGTERQWVAIGVDSPDPKSTQPTKLYWASLVDRKVTPGPSFLPDEILLGYSPEQGRLLTAEVRGTWATPVRFCTYRILPGETSPKAELKWSVPKVSFASSSKATRVAFLDKDRVLIGYGGSVGLWNLATKRMEYAVPSSHNELNLSPDRKYFCTNQFSHCVFVDTDSGRPIANLKQYSTAWFSETGDYLLAASGGGIYAFSPNNPKTSIFLPAASQLGNSQARDTSSVAEGWLSDGYALWSLARGILIWTYKGSSKEIKMVRQMALADKLLAIGTRSAGAGKDSVLIGVAKIPHTAAIAANESVDNEKLYVLKPGARIRIAPDVTDTRMLEGIRRAAAKVNWIIDESSDIVVTASAKLGESVTRTFELSRFGRSSNRDSSFQETVTTTPWIQSLSVTQAGVSLWGTSSGGVPTMVMMREGDSLQAELSKSSEPSYALFSNFEFPERIIAPKYANGLGSSLITPAGLTDIPIE